MTAALRRSFSSLQVPNYRLYFGGQVVSLAGNWMQIVAELWLILALTGSGVAVGVAAALQFTGILLFGALGGALADRFDKRKLLMVSQSAMVVPAALLAVLAATGAAEAWMVFALIGLRGLILAVDNPARQSFVIEIVGPERVISAVSLNSVLIHSARIVGPAIAGIVIALFSIALVFAINALTFVAMLIALARMRPSQLTRPEPQRTRGGVRHALRYVMDTPELRTPLLLMAVLGTLGFNFQVIIPLLADRTFGGEVSAYALLTIAMGIGSILGALTLGARNQASRGLIALAALGFGIASLLAAAAPSLPLMMAALGLLGICSVTFAAGINSGLQLAAAPEMRGRIMALYSIVFLGSTVFGGPLAGLIGEAVDPRASLAMAGATGLLVAIGASLGWRDRPVPTTESSSGVEGHGAGARRIGYPRERRPGQARLRSKHGRAPVGEDQPRR